MPRPKIKPLKNFNVEDLTSFPWQTRHFGPHQPLANFPEGRVVEDIRSEGIDPEDTTAVRDYLETYK